jgi:hypothetical protein
MLDLRSPAGFFFAIVGALLLAVSLTSPEAPMLDANLTGAKVDLYTGLAMLAFGVVLLLLAKRSRRA